MADSVEPATMNFFVAVMQNWIFLTTALAAVGGGLWCGHHRKGRGDNSTSFLSDASNAGSAWLLMVLAFASVSIAIGYNGLFEDALRNGGLMLVLGLGYSSYMCARNVYSSAKGIPTTFPFPAPDEFSNSHTSGNEV